MNSIDSEEIGFNVIAHSAAPDMPERESMSADFTLAFPLIRGRVEIMEGNSTVFSGEARLGMIRLQKPGVAVRIKHYSPCRILVVNIPKQQFVDLTCGLDLGGNRIAAHDPIRHSSLNISGLAKALTSADQFQDAPRRLFIGGIVQSLLALHFEAHATDADRSGSSTANRLSDAQFERCRDYAVTRFMEGIDLDTWAAVVGMPTSEFSRRFLETAKMSPYSWFLEQRIRRAKDVLLSEKTPIASVAYELGFSSQSHFTRTFSQRVGLSPARWRASHDVAGS